VDRRQFGSSRTAICAASTSKKRSASNLLSTNRFLVAVHESPFSTFSCLCIYKRNLLKSSGDNPVL
jgi:hypothetical protein